MRRESPKPRITRSHNSVGYVELTWSQVQSILQNAERGYTEQFADLTRRMLKTDDHVLSTYETRVSPIAGARREVVAREVPEHLQRFADAAAADCQLALDGLPNPDRFVAEAVDADFTSFAVHEIIWKPRADMVWPSDAIWLHPRRFRWTDSYEIYLYDDGQAKARADELGIEVPKGMLGMPLSANKYIVHSPRIIPDYPTSNGLALSIVRPWWIKSWVTKFWLAGAESAGNTRFVGELPQGAADDVAVSLREGLEQISADGVAVTREGSRIVIHAPTAEGSGSVWEVFLKRCDAAISKAMLGSTLNVEVGDAGGNRSLGESQADMTTAPRWTRSAASLANTIESQLFRPFLEMNRHRYGGHVFVPQLKFHIVEDEPTIDAELIGAGVVTVDELRQSRKLPPWGPDKGGDAIVRPAAPAAPAFSRSVEAAPARPLAQSPTPWERAMSMALSAGPAVTVTSGHSPTTPSASKR